MYKVVISPSANADLSYALKYIAYKLENHSAAENWQMGLKNAMPTLKKCPLRTNSAETQCFGDLDIADIR